jgi:uncharacterized membrane protein YphA (DoxX/SURF4 family)
MNDEGGMDMVMTAERRSPHRGSVVLEVHDEGTVAERDSRGYQAFRLLQLGFIAAPIIAGLDKFTHFLVNWDQYLAPWIAQALPIRPEVFMMAVGIIEVAAGLLVAFKPRIGGYVVGAWLLGIVVNLITYPGYFDIALRDFGLALGAIALARLSEIYDAR